MFSRGEKDIMISFFRDTTMLKNENTLKSIDKTKEKE